MRYFMLCVAVLVIPCSIFHEICVTSYSAPKLSMLIFICIVSVSYSAPRLIVQLQNICMVFQNMNYVCSCKPATLLLICAGQFL
jgi:hypothetical protein